MLTGHTLLDQVKRNTRDDPSKMKTGNRRKQSLRIRQQLAVKRGIVLTDKQF